MLTLVDAPSPNFNERLFPLDMLVLHYTGMKDGPTALARMRDPAAEVSAHYMVEEDGTVFRLVPEPLRAWHAGRSRWMGQGDLNSRSIGIEIVNGGHDFGLPPYPDVQIEVVIELCRAIVARWAIPQVRIVGHSDIAPARKEDPGELFPWRRLAEAGIGLWPQVAADAAAEGGDIAGDLRAIGYALDPAEGWEPPALEKAVRAFQRRWRPSGVTGEADAETRATARAVAALYRASAAGAGLTG